MDLHIHKNEFSCTYAPLANFKDYIAMNFEHININCANSFKNCLLIYYNLICYYYYFSSPQPEFKFMSFSDYLLLNCDQWNKTEVPRGESKFNIEI